MDVARFSFNRGSQLALRLLYNSNYNLTYERFGLFQSLGWTFKKRNVPWVVEANEVFYQEAVRDRQALHFQEWAKKEESFVYNNCDLIVAITPSLKKLLMQAFNLPSEKILVIPNGVSRFEIRDRPKQKSKQTFNIVFVGLLTQWIGLQFLIEAITKTDLPISVDVLGDGPYRKELERLTQKFGVESKVKFRGFIKRPELFEFVDNADVGYSGHIPLSTDRFHSPMKLYEYLSRGLPVVASDDEDSENMIGKNNLGFIFRRGDVESLVETLHTAWAARDMWQEMGSKACDLMADNHTWADRIKILTDHLESQGTLVSTT